MCFLLLEQGRHSLAVPSPTRVVWAIHSLLVSRFAVHYTSELALCRTTSVTRVVLHCGALSQPEALRNLGQAKTPQ